MLSGKQFQFLGLRGFVGWYEHRWRPGGSPSVPSGHHQLLSTVRQGWPESARIPPVHIPAMGEPEGITRPITLTWVLEIKLRVSHLGGKTLHTDLHPGQQCLCQGRRERRRRNLDSDFTSTLGCAVIEPRGRTQIQNMGEVIRRVSWRKA